MGRDALYIISSFHQLFLSSYINDGCVYRLNSPGTHPTVQRTAVRPLPTHHTTPPPANPPHDTPSCQPATRHPPHDAPPQPTTSTTPDDRRLLIAAGFNQLYGPPPAHPPTHTPPAKHPMNLQRSIREPSVLFAQNEYKYEKLV